MLVLTRKLGQTIKIGDTIQVTVVEIDRGKIRLGVVAPGMMVDREEVHERRQLGLPSPKDRAPASS